MADGLVWFACVTSVCMPQVSFILFVPWSTFACVCVCIRTCVSTGLLMMFLFVLAQCWRGKWRGGVASANRFTHSRKMGASTTRSHHLLRLSNTTDVLSPVVNINNNNNSGNDDILNFSFHRYDEPYMRYVNINADFSVRLSRLSVIPLQLPTTNSALAQLR